ncbi:uncharacterized protein L201_000985 [Kwoniella dendrophila CBS 6074]|uniref:Ribonuclease P/MRP protein subunit POP5 n=1 Tax=Kwoniella dendrophila CBS 6074 TaxID=1295534 RepID=A0AAX4JL48_9TREE
MVRYKNRYLLVEFLVPSTFESTLQNTNVTDIDISEEEAINLDGIKDESDDEDEEDEEMPITPIPKIPFVIPNSKPILGLGDENASQQVIYKAIRNVIQDIFGDEGWARVASSFRVIYHSPLTTLTFIRIARPYYRLIWSGITFLNQLNKQQIIPRILGVSGTIKKLQNLGISYHRLIIAQLLNYSLTSSSDQQKSISGNGLGDKGKLKKESEREIEEINRLNENQ